MKKPTIIQKLIQKLSKAALNTAEFVARHVKPETGQKFLAFGLGIFMLGTLAGCSCDDTLDLSTDSSNISIVDTESSVDYNKIYKDLLAGIGDLTNSLEDLNSSMEESYSSEYQAEIKEKLASLYEKYEELKEQVHAMDSQEAVNGVIDDIKSIESQLETIFSNMEELKENIPTEIQDIKELCEDYKKSIAKEMILDGITRVFANGYHSFDFDGMTIVSAQNGDYAWYNTSENKYLIYSDGIEHKNYNGEVGAEFNSEVSLSELIPVYLNMNHKVVSATIEKTVITLNYSDEDSLQVYMNNSGEVISVSLNENGVQKDTVINEIDKADYQNRVDMIASKASTYSMYSFITDKIEESYQDAACLNVNCVINNGNTPLYQMINGINKTCGQITESEYAVYENGITTIYKIEDDGSVSINEYESLAMCTVDALMRSLNYAIFNPDYKFITEYDEENNKYIVKGYYNSKTDLEQEVYLIFDENNKLVECGVDNIKIQEKFCYRFNAITRTEFNEKYVEIKNMILDAKKDLNNQILDEVE